MRWREKNGFILFLLLVKILSVDSQTFKRYVTSSYTIPKDFPLNHLAVDQRNNNVYVSAVNRLYMLDKSLSLIKEEVETGPRNDSKKCEPLKPLCNPDKAVENCCVNLNLMDNTNRLLLIDPGAGQLIVCGTLYQGSCITRSLSNIKNIIHDIPTEAKQGEIFDYVVCAQTSDCSAVALIAEGPTANNSVLYVATTKDKRLGNEDYKHLNPQVPWLSTRSLARDPTKENLMFWLAVDQSSMAQFASDKDGTTRDYKYIFATSNEDGFVYYIFQQTNETASVAWIARICKNDNTYGSYIQMRIACSNNKKPGHVLGAYHVPDGSFLGGDGENNDDGLLLLMFKEGQNSVLCEVGVGELNKLFDDTQTACFKNNTRDGEFVASLMFGGTTCKNKEDDSSFLFGDENLDSLVIRKSSLPRLTYNEDYDNRPKGSRRCGAAYLPSYLQRNREVIARKLFEAEGKTFTSLLPSIFSKNGVRVEEVFIGTWDGSIIQVNLEQREAYNTVKLGSAILTDMILDDDPDLSVPQYYAMTKSGGQESSNTVYLMKAADCSQYVSCDTCLNARNPHCGWCILENSCIPHSTPCTKDSLLSPLSNKCISVAAPTPVERTINGEVVLNISMLPELSGDDYYECAFKDIGVYPLESSSDNKLSCKVPPSSSLPNNIRGTDYVDVALSIRYNGETEIVSTTVTFYECEEHGKTLNLNQPCSGCINSRGNGCMWCTLKHSCVPVKTADDKCTQGIQDNQLCPRITGVVETDRLISVGIAKSISVSVEYLPSEETNWSCEVDTGDGKPVETPATRKDNMIQCHSTQYNYSRNAAESNGNIRLRGSTVVVDMLDNEPLTFYKCSVDRSDCTLCVTADSKYQCGWCEKSSKCEVQEHCSSEDALWNTEASECPDAIITSLSPISGPKNGGTILSISGKNLGSNPADINYVKVVGVECSVLSSSYQVSQKVTCKTGEIGMLEKGKVEVNVRGKSVSSTQDFTYRNPVLKQPQILKGPQAGGTALSITGDNLDTGSNIKVFIGKYECKVISSITDSSITCVTSPSGEINRPLKITAAYDQFFNTTSDWTYTYKENPEIEKYSMPSSPLAGFEAGGRIITFIGSNFDVIQAPQLETLVSFNGRKRRDTMSRLVKYMMRQRRSIGEEKAYTTFCTVHNASTMTCPTPEVELNAIGYPAGAALVVVMDNHRIELDQDLLYFPNPSNFTLDNPKEIKDFLLIKVENLNEAAVTVSEINVTIGSAPCIVDNIDENSLLCKIPEQPGKDIEYEVSVVIGNKAWDIGVVSYRKENPVINDQMKKILIAVGIVLVIIVVVIILFCFRKNKQLKGKKNDFQKAMENLEMEVRADFRKAFAELSIDMTDLTADVWDSGIPCLSYRLYATNLFFPSVRYHPCMKDPDPTEKPIPVVQQGLSHFEILLETKQFLMVFVRTLEEQHVFNNRDKSNVASLITVVLHQKLDYFTEIMKSLIADTVAAGLQKNAKLVLRRTESVAERMLSNWIAICLYPYIRDTAGKSFFLLQKAIKHQVSKGPLDGITGKTRYTLSDDRLLKEDVESEVLTLFVKPLNARDDDDPVMVKVLSCDSTAQVKEKVMDAMYMKVPLSQRPRADQLDLEWRHGRGGHLILPERDFAMEAGSRWRRLMTIKDYKVPNNATLALVQRQQTLFPQETNHFNNHTAANAQTPMLQDEPNTRIYHLVKYSDDLDNKRESTIPRDRKHINDLYLLRLINMKGILQNYVDDVFRAILDKQTIPCAVKHFFDFLDELATKHGIDDPEILHIWKTNSVLGRFWVTILNNSEFVFDIDKPESVESSMSVISQTFIDACSVQEHKPTPFSPINKQLYAKEIPTYKKMVHEYYEEIKMMPTVSDQDMHAHMAEISRNHHDLKFDTHVALNELWGFVNKYYDELLEALEDDMHVSQQVITRLKQAYELIYSSVNNP